MSVLPIRSWFLARLTSSYSAYATPYQQWESSGSPPQGVLHGTSHGASGVTSDSDGVSGKPHQESWRVIGGGVMLGTPTSECDPLYFSPTNRSNLQKRRDVSTGTEAITILHPRGGRSLDWIVRRKPQVKPVHGRKSRILRSCLFLQVRQQSTSVGRCHRETQVVASDYKGLSTCGQSDSFPVGFHQQSLIESTTQAFFAYAEVA